MALTKRMTLQKGSKGGGVIFNPKICVADFGNFKQGLLSMKLIQNAEYAEYAKGEVKSDHFLLL